MKQVSTQINVDYGAERVIAIDRLAAKQSISRADLLRKGADEMIAADQEGREPFRHGAPEFGADEGRHLLREVRVLTTELERLTRDNARLKAELTKMVAVFQQDAATARERAAREVAEALEQALEPFRAEVAGLKEENAKQQAGLEAALAKQPRTQHNLVLGDDRFLSLKFLVAMTSVISLLSSVVTLAMTVVDHPFGMFVVDKIVPGDRGICELIQYRHGVSDCRVPGIADVVPLSVPESLPAPASRLHHRR